MGIMGSSVGITRFRTPGSDNSCLAIMEKLERHCFSAIDETPGIEESIGWVSVFDKNVTLVAGEYSGVASGFEWNGYHVFSLRRDIRRVPGVVLRDEVKKAQAEWLVAHPGFQRVPKQKREEIADAVKLALLVKTLPVPTVWDVAWNPMSGDLLFFSTSPKAVDLFETMFRKTFQVSLRLVTPIEQAFAAAPMFDMANYNQATTESVLDLLKANLWVGSWLCSWALATSVTTQMVVGEEPGRAGVYIDRRINLIGAAESGSQKINITGSQERMQAVKAALLEGKTITGMGITFVTERDGTEVEWRFVLEADTFAIKSLKTPSIIVEEDDRDNAEASATAALICKLAMVQEFYGHFNDLLLAYMRQYVNNREGLLETVRGFSEAGDE